MKTTIEKFISMLCLDNRIPNGIFLIENNDHMNILEEYLIKYGIDIQEARKTRNKVLEGRFPERQAYNKDGILVTFPTPEYKQRAIQRGTHFEQNPVKQQANIFNQQPAQQPAQQPDKKETPREQPSQLQPAPETPQQVIQTQAAQTTPPEPTVAPVEPVGELQPQTTTATVIPPSDDKTPDQKQAEAEYVEKLLKTEVSIDEAKKLGWKCTLNNIWYDSRGNIKGKTIYNESKNKQVISFI